MGGILFVRTKASLIHRFFIINVSFFVLLEDNILSILFLYIDICFTVLDILLSTFSLGEFTGLGLSIKSSILGKSSNDGSAWCASALIMVKLGTILSG